jgi:hypothetical protein
MRPATVLVGMLFLSIVLGPGWLLLALAAAFGLLAITATLVGHER